MKNSKRFISIIMATLIFISTPIISYTEAQAAGADLVIEGGAIALKEILLKLMMSAGLIYAGYEAADITFNEPIAHKFIKEAFESDPKVAAALADAVEWESSMQGEMLPSDYSFKSSSGFSISNGAKAGSKKGISVSLTAGLITAARDAVKKWADSNENIFEGDMDASLAGTQEVSSEYMSSITTTVKSIPSLASMKDIDTFFGIDGAYDYLSLAGYSDSKYYFLIYVSGAKTYFMPIPVGYSVVGYRTARLGKEGVVILSNANAKNAISQNGIRDSSSFYSYFFGLPIYTGNHYIYDVSSGSWTQTENQNFVPSYGELSGRYNLTNWYTCNYQAAYANGASISYNNFTTQMVRILYTFKTVSKHLTYNPSTAFPIPSDGVDFDIPEDNFAGFDYPDLSALLSYVSSLSDELSRWREEQDKNQETIIQQGKDTLSAINNMHSTIGKISTFVGRIVTSVLSMERLLKGLPAQIADALGDTLVLPGLDDLTQGIVDAPGLIVGGLTDALPDILADALAVTFPNAALVFESILSFPQDMAKVMEGVSIAVPDIVIPDITIPDIVIPDIIIPDITIPDITVPDVFVDFPAITLDPSYEITVQEDYLVLGDVISDSVNGVMTDVFVPNEAATLEKIGEMQEYFKFTEDMEDIVTEFKKSVFGITPSPILKIPIGKPKSKKYNYGTGSYIIIDVSWYAEYKDFGDKIILAFAWVFFIWRMFVLLPGIINGTVGGFFTPQRVEGVALDAEIRKNYADLHKISRDYTSGGVYGRFTGKFKD